MDIHVISTLTSEDEQRVAGDLLQAVSGVLNKLPIAYAVRVETAGAHIVQHTHLEDEDSALENRSRRVIPIR